MPLTRIPDEAVDVTRFVAAGYNMPPDRIPGSQSVAQMAFAVGRNFKVRDLKCPAVVHSWTDPILGTFFICTRPGEPTFLAQAWPHPQVGGAYLITATVER